MSSPGTAYLIEKATRIANIAGRLDEELNFLLPKAIADQLARGADSENETQRIYNSLPKPMADMVAAANPRAYDHWESQRRKVWELNSQLQGVLSETDDSAPRELWYDAGKSRPTSQPTIVGLPWPEELESLREAVDAVYWLHVDFDGLWKTLEVVLN